MGPCIAMDRLSLNPRGSSGPFVPIGGSQPSRYPDCLPSGPGAPSRRAPRPSPRVDLPHPLLDGPFPGLGRGWNVFDQGSRVQPNSFAIAIASEKSRQRRSASPHSLSRFARSVALPPADPAARNTQTIAASTPGLGVSREIREESSSCGSYGSKVAIAPSHGESAQYHRKLVLALLLTLAAAHPSLSSQHRSPSNRRSPSKTRASFRASRAESCREPVTKRPSDVLVVIGGVIRGDETFVLVPGKPLPGRRTHGPR